MPPTTPYIPETLVVHLGAPDSNARNVTVTFPDYIKNVASSEIYPTWDESAILSNIYVQISFALNKIYTEFYRSRGYEFDITNSTAFDQKFIYGREIFDNIDRIVDEVFNDYIRRQGLIEPLAARYCNGTTVTCEGLSQWGSQDLATQGYSSVDILRFYYGNDIELVIDAPVREIAESYPGYPLSVGDSGNDVTTIQFILNLVSQSYPAIPKIPEYDGVFGSQTRNAVIEFQRIFNLTPDGIVGKSTWYKLIFLYTGLLRLSELDSEGQRIYDLEYPDAISIGDTGDKVFASQFLLAVASSIYASVPFVRQTGVFGSETQNAVIQFQNTFGLPQTGVIDNNTWDLLYETFVSARNTYPSGTDKFGLQILPFPGELRLNSRGSGVRLLQDYINRLSNALENVNIIPVTGVFTQITETAVRNVQAELGLPITGVVNEETWRAMSNELRKYYTGINTLATQYPGMLLEENMSDRAEEQR